MGSNPDHIMSASKSQDDQVTWIGRDRPRIPTTAAPETPGAASSGSAAQGRWKWTIGALVAILLIATLAWRLMAGSGKPPVSLEERSGIFSIHVRDTYLDPVDLGECGAAFLVRARRNHLSRAEQENDEKKYKRDTRNYTSVIHLICSPLLTLIKSAAQI